MTWRPGTPEPRGRRGPLPGRARSSRGFSLVELLVVIVILAALFAIAAAGLAKQARMARLLAVSNSIEALAQRTRFEMQRRGHAMFLRITERDANNERRLQLWEDTNDNRILQDGGGDTRVDEVLLPDWVSLSRTNVANVDQTLWADLGSGRFGLGIDFLGRTFNPTSGRQINGIATVSVTHEQMVSGELSPMVDYQFRLNPVWNASTSRLVKGKDF